MPTVGEYFERRVRPRIDSGVGLVKVKYDKYFDIEYNGEDYEYGEDYDYDSLALAKNWLRGRPCKGEILNTFIAQKY